jgi:hypothetical protein
MAGLVYLDSVTDPNNPTMRTLNKGDAGILKIFIHYVFSRDEISDPIGGKWTSNPKKTFISFVVTLNTRDNVIPWHVIDLLPFHQLHEFQHQQHLQHLHHHNQHHLLLICEKEALSMIPQYIQS